MSGSVEIVLWLQEYKLQALEAQLARDGCSTEKLLQDMLDDLYHRRVPLDIQREISERLDAEAAAELAERDANTTWAAYHITEHGDDQYFKTPTGDELLTAAGRLRSYLHQGEASRWPRFSSLLFHRQEIRKEEFEQLFSERLENTGRVSGVFEIDLDADTFSAASAMDGWHTYRIRDVSTAAYHAFRKQSLSSEERWERLLSKLDGKELTPDSASMVLRGSRRLRPEEISFQDEVSECGNRLSFYVPVTFEPDEVFGTQVATAANDDYLNVYADFDLDTGEVCDALTVIYVCGDGAEEAYRYPLTEEERAVLRTRMDGGWTATAWSRPGWAWRSTAVSIWPRRMDPRRGRGCRRLCPPRVARRKALCALFPGQAEPCPSRAVCPRSGPFQARDPWTKKRQAESPDAFLRPGPHFCPQCGQFPGSCADAFLLPHKGG